MLLITAWCKFRKQGAILIDHLQITNIDEIYRDPSEDIAMAAEFKIALNAYLKELVTSPVRSLADVIAFNNKNSKLVSQNRKFKFFKFTFVGLIFNLNDGASCWF